MKALETLKKLELAIYDAGVDGGMATSDAITDLREEEARLGILPSDAAPPRWQNPSYEDTETVLRHEARETPAGKLLIRYGFEPWDMESSARRVAKKAAAEIAELTEALELMVNMSKGDNFSLMKAARARSLAILARYTP